MPIRAVMSKEMIQMRHRRVRRSRQAISPILLLRRPILMSKRREPSPCNLEGRRTPIRWRWAACRKRVISLWKLNNLISKMYRRSLTYKANNWAKSNSKSASKQTESATITSNSSNSRCRSSSSSHPLSHSPISWVPYGTTLRSISKYSSSKSIKSCNFSNYSMTRTKIAGSGQSKTPA